MEEEILFKNTTKLKKEIYEEYSHFYYTKYKKYYYKTTLVMFFSAFLLFGVFSPIYQAVKLGDVSVWVVYIGIIYLSICIGVLLSPSKIKKPKQSLEYYYEFTKDKMVINTNIHITQEIIYDKYDPIYRVCEYKGYIYFITLNDSAYILSKDEFKKGNKEEFIKYLKEIYKDKYIDFNNTADKQQFKRLYNKADITTAFWICALIILLILAITSSLLIHY